MPYEDQLQVFSLWKRILGGEIGSMGHDSFLEMSEVLLHGRRERLVFLGSRSKIRNNGRKFPKESFLV